MEKKHAKEKEKISKRKGSENIEKRVPESEIRNISQSCKNNTPNLLKNSILDNNEKILNMKIIKNVAILKK